MIKCRRQQQGGEPGGGGGGGGDEEGLQVAFGRGRGGVVLLFIYLFILKERKVVCRAGTNRFLDFRLSSTTA